VVQVDDNSNAAAYASCLSAANALLHNGVESHMCAQYIASTNASGPSGSNDTDYSIKFVSCNSMEKIWCPLTRDNPGVTMKIFNKNAFSVIEYAILFVIIIGAFLLMRDNIQRGIYGLWGQSGKSFAYGRQYDPQKQLNVV